MIGVRFMATSFNDAHANSGVKRKMTLKCVHGKDSVRNCLYFMHGSVCLQKLSRIIISVRIAGSDLKLRTPVLYVVAY